MKRISVRLLCASLIGVMLCAQAAAERPRPDVSSYPVPPLLNESGGSISRSNRTTPTAVRGAGKAWPVARDGMWVYVSLQPDSRKSVKVWADSVGRTPPCASNGLPSSVTEPPMPEPEGVLGSEPAEEGDVFCQPLGSARVQCMPTLDKGSIELLFVDRTVREREAGLAPTQIAVYERRVLRMASRAGQMTVDRSFGPPARRDDLARRRKGPSVVIEYLHVERQIVVGVPMQFRFKVIDPATNQPKEDLDDLELVCSQASRAWEKRLKARSLGEGVYQVDVVVPWPGVYKVFFESPSIRARDDELPYLVLKAREAEGEDGTRTDRK